MRRIRVVHIVGGLTVGGAEKQLLELCRRFDRERFELHLCWYSRSDEDLHAEFEAAGVRTIFFDKFDMPIWAFFRRMCRTLRDVQPDIVHTWLYSANFWGRWAAVACGHRRIIASYRAEVDRIAAGPAPRLSENLLHGVGIRLVNSETVARSLTQHYDAPPDRIRVIYNGVELPQVDRDRARWELRAELNVPESALLITMVGRVAPIKNHPMFVRMARRVGEQRPAARFLIVGRGPALASVEALVNELDLADRVRLLGLRDDVPRILAASDVFCFTSYSEGFPNAVLEAMASGLAVVSTASDGVRELIRDGTVGLLTPMEDDAAMAAHVLRLLDDPQRRRRIGDAAAAMVRRDYTWDAMVRQTQDLYEELVESDGKA